MADLNQNFQQLEEANVRSILLKYLRYWPLFILLIISSLIAVFFYLRYWSQPQYEATSTILIKNLSDGKGINENGNLANMGLLQTSRSLDDEIGIFTSWGVMEEVISENAFNITYYTEGRFKDLEVYGDSVPVKVLVDETAESLVYGLPINIKFIDSLTYELSTVYNDEEFRTEHNYGDLVSLPYATFSIVLKEEFLTAELPSPMYFMIGNKDQFINGFLSSLSVMPDNETGSLLRLSFISSDRTKGEDVLSALIETYIEKTINYENELAENTIKIIDERIKVLSGEIEDVENSIVDFKSQNLLTDVSSNANSYIQQANDYKKRTEDYQTQIDILNNIERSLVNGNSESIISGSFSISDDALSDLINRYNESFLEKQELSRSAVSSNPILTNLQANLDNLRNSILQNIKSAKNELIITRGNLLNNANRYNAQIARVPAMEKRLLDISRNQSTKESLYLYLLQKREEEVLSLAAPVSSTRMVSLPKAGLYPISPNKRLFYLGGGLLGFFLSFSIVYMMDALNNKVKTVEDISNLISVPILGEISKSKEKEAILLDDKKRSPAAELFRLLRFNLEYLKKTEKNQTLLVTSTVKGEGKTFIASNLAATLASNGEKVIALTFDLREPQLMDRFDLPNTPGITDFIVDKKMNVKQIIQKHPTIDNLFLVGPGMELPQVGRLILSRRVEELLNELKKDFDRVILDTAPIGIISDAFALNPHVDSTIYVVRKDVTKKEHLKTIDGIYRNKKLNNTMVLLNDTKTPEAYGSYGYGK